MEKLEVVIMAHYDIAELIPGLRLIYNDMGAAIQLYWLFFTLSIGGRWSD